MPQNNFSTMEKRISIHKFNLLQFCELKMRQRTCKLIVILIETVVQIYNLITLGFSLRETMGDGGDYDFIPSD